MAAKSVAVTGQPGSTLSIDAWRRAIILAAGVGSRMNAIAGGRPKCLMPLHGRPLIHHQLDLLEAAGVPEVVVITGWGAEAIRAATGSRARFRHCREFAGKNNL